MLEASGLHSFYGGAHILHGVGLKLGDSEVAALLGRNGAGKTTTFKTLMGLVRPRRGKVTYDGRDITGWQPHRVCQSGLGYVPEERRIFKDLTVLENIEVGRRPPREGAPTWSEEKLFALFPNLAERRRNLGGQLSGGEQQMLTIARTLMGNPRTILLDEPSEGIAPIIVEQMAHAILELKREGLAVLISEQNLHFAKLVSDRAYIIEGGEMRYEGSIPELEANEEIREAYLAV